KREGKVLVWQYAPGYLTPAGYSTEAMAALTGIHIKTEPGAHEAGLRSRFASEPVGPLSQHLPADVQGRLMSYGVDLPAQRFTVADAQAEVFAAYTEDGQPSAAA